MSIEKTITTLVFDVPPMLYHLVRYGLTERVEHARDNVTRPWLAACQLAPVAQPDTMDADELRQRIHAALFDTPSCDDSMVSLVDAVLLAFGPALDERAEYRAEAKQLGKDAGAFHAALQEIAEIIECGSVGAREVPGKVRELIDKQREQNEWLSDKLTEMVDVIVAEGWKQWCDEMDVAAQRAALWTLLKRAVRMYRREAAIASDHDGCQISRLEAAVHLRDAAIEQLRVDLDHARQQLPGTAGQTVTLHLENGSTTTGRLEVHDNQRTVRGLLVDVVGRSLVVVPDGGGDRG